MADATGVVVNGITGLLSSDAFPILMILLVFGIIGAYALMLWLAHKGF